MKRRRKKLPRTIVETLNALGLEVLPVDQRSREWLTLQAGLSRLVGRDVDSKGKPKPLTEPMRRELADFRRKLREERGHTSNPAWRYLKNFNLRNVREARSLAKSDSVIKRLDSLPRSAGDVVFIPDDERGVRKRFLNYDEFLKFATLPHYKKDLSALLSSGKFVVGPINSDTGELYQRKNGKPIYKTVLLKGTDIHGERVSRNQKRKTPKAASRKKDRRAGPKAKGKAPVRKGRGNLARTRKKAPRRR